MIHKKVDKLICGWSMLTGHSFKKEELNSLVDLIASETEKELADFWVDLRQDRPYLHWCAEWDGLLIDDSYPEIEVCLCFDKSIKKRG